MFAQPHPGSTACTYSSLVLAITDYAVALPRVMYLVMSMAGSTLCTDCAPVDREPIMTWLLTTCPPRRCSSMMRSSTRGDRRSYQTPSGYTTAMGPWQASLAARGGSRLWACATARSKGVERSGSYDCQERLGRGTELKPSVTSNTAKQQQELSQRQLRQHITVTFGHGWG